MKYYTIMESESGPQGYSVRSVDATSKDEAESLICKSDYMSYRGIYTADELKAVMFEMVALARVNHEEDVFLGQKQILSPTENVWVVLTRDDLEKVEYEIPDGFYDYYHMSEIKTLVKNTRVTGITPVMGVA